MHIKTIGLDLAKNVLQVHGVDDAGKVVLKKQVRRAQLLPFFAARPPCLVGMEACATAHHWARELSAFGHEVRLIPAQYAKAYVKRNKNDAADAEAICEAVTRPSMRFVAVKTVEQQAGLVLHRTRDLLIRQRTMLINALRGHLAEFGIIAPQGPQNIGKLVAVLQDETDERIPAFAREVLDLVVKQLASLAIPIEAVEAKIRSWFRTNQTCRRLATIPGVGPIVATALVATIGDPKAFASGRNFAAWLGLTPRQNSTGGKQRLGGITKRGDGYLRRLLLNGTQAVLRWSKTAKADPWLDALGKRKPPMVVAVALANKTARIIWAVWTRSTEFRRPARAN